MAHTGASPHSHSNGARQPNVFNCGLSEPVVLWLVKASCFAPCKSHLARVIQPFLMWPNKCESVLFECKGVGLRRRHACLHETPSTCRSVRPSCAGALRAQRAPRIACNRHQYQQWRVGEGVGQQRWRTPVRSPDCRLSSESAHF